MANTRFELASGRAVGVSAFGDPGSRRVVLFCHPTPGAGRFDPDPTVTALAEVRLLAVDRPGYGRSDPQPPDENPLVQRFADDLAEYLRRTSATAQEMTGRPLAPVGVVGWSFGGCVALSLAARHPELVGNIAVIGISRPSRIRHGDPTSSSLEMSPRARASTVPKMIARLPSNPPRTIAALGITGDNPILVQPGLTNRLDHMLDDAFTQNTIGVATDRVAARDTSWSRELERITADTLIVHGESDPVADASDRRWFRRHIPRARTLAVPGARHLAIVSAWEQILDHVAP